MKLISSSLVLLMTLTVFSGCIMDSQTELLDTDGDGLIDSEDVDDDGDGWSDSDEAACGSNGYEQDSIPIDTDLDGVCDFMDSDNDGDGVLDYDDKFPYDSNESKDLDGDGVGNTRDLDDDGDGWSDENEVICQTNSLDISSIPIDSDGDRICDIIDPDLESLLYEWRRWWNIEALFKLNPELVREQVALNMVTWQTENGGWEKYSVDYYLNEWNGSIDKSYNTKHGTDLGSFKDMATTAHIRFIAQQYLDSNNTTNKNIFKASVESGVSFILEAQHITGGWPGVWPERTCMGCTYSNLMTFNDHVMTTVVLLLWDLVNQRNQFSSGILDNVNSTQLSIALDSGIQFILDTQIVVNGIPTIWAQQYNRTTLEPAPARTWELPCRTPNESEGIVAILLNWPERTPEIINATWGAVEWYEQNMLEDVWFDKPNGEIINREGYMMWYRYYNVSDDQFFLSGENSVKIYNLFDLEPQVKRTTYRWAGEWGIDLITETAKIPSTERY